MQSGTTLELTHMVRMAEGSQIGDRSGTLHPGLLLLHGIGAHEGDLMPISSELDPRFTVVAARAPIRYGPGFAWYLLPQIGVPDPATLRTSVDAVAQFIRDMATAYNLDPARIYLMGFSQGAMLASAVALCYPGLTAGVVMHSGYVPKDSGLPFDIAGASGKPFFIAQGLYDPTIPLEMGRQAYAYLNSINVRATFKEYPIAHSISDESLGDISEWLTSRLDGEPAEANT